MVKSLKQYYLLSFLAYSSLIYGLVYFFPYNEFGEPTIPIYFKLILDVLLVFSFFVFGLKRKISSVLLVYLIFLFLVFIVGTIHLLNIPVTDYLHFTVRNVLLYNSIFFLAIFSKINSKTFHVFHERLFYFILYFGLFLFILKKLDIPNPFGFGYWMWEKNRLITTWLNPNSLGFYMLFYLYYFYFKAKKLDYRAVLILITLLLTGSLTAISGVFFLAAYIVITFLKGLKVRTIHVLIFTLSIPVVIILSIYYGIFDYLIFKIEVLFLEKNTNFTSVSNRLKNLQDLYEYLSADNFLSVLFGDFGTDKYIRLDSQYLNIFYNYGLLALLSYLLFQIMLFLKFLNGNSYYSKAMMLFSIWLFLVAFNLTAYLYRPNIIVFYILMILFILRIEKFPSEWDKIQGIK